MRTWDIEAQLRDQSKSGRGTEQHIAGSEVAGKYCRLQEVNIRSHTAIVASKGWPALSDQVAFAATQKLLIAGNKQTAGASLQGLKPVSCSIDRHIRWSQAA